MSGPEEVRAFIVKFVEQYMDSPEKGMSITFVYENILIYSVLFHLVTAHSKQECVMITEFIMNSLERCPQAFLSAVHPLPVEHSEWMNGCTCVPVDGGTSQEFRGRLRMLNVVHAHNPFESA